MLAFFKKYFLKLGILDGYEGYVISISTAYGKFLKYIKLRELEKRDEIRDSQLVDWCPNRTGWSRFRENNEQPPESDADFF